MAGENDSDPYERFFRPRPGEGMGPQPEPRDSGRRSRRRRRIGRGSASTPGRDASDDPGAGSGRGPGSRRHGGRGRRAARGGGARSADTTAAAAEADVTAEADTTTVTTSGAASTGIAAPASRRRGSARRRRILLMASGIVSLVVLAVSGGAWALQDYLLGQIKRVDAFGGLTNRPHAGPKGALNILVAGVDRREGLSRQVQRKLRLGHQEGQRSDTMMVVHLSERHDRATVVSLPRDSLVTIPAHRDRAGRPIPQQRNKLNAAFSWGGHKLAIQTIERNTGIRIDHYVEINFLGFIKMVDALGGVEICTPTPINDRKSGLSLPPGRRVVDGTTALAYVRTRYSLTGGSDLGRVQRQQRFMAAMMRRALSTQTLAHPGKLSAFLGATLAAVRLDEGLSRDTVTRLATQLKGVSTDNVTFTTVPISNPGQTIKDLGSVAEWDPRGAVALFGRIKTDQPVTGAPAKPPSSAPTAPGGGSGGGSTGGNRPVTVPPNRIEVRVLNGTSTPGLGAKAAAALRQAGFIVDGPAANARTGGVRTIIQHGPDRRDSAETLRAAIPGSRLRMVPALQSRVRVIVGSSWAGAKEVSVNPPGQAGHPGHSVQATTASHNACT